MKILVKYCLAGLCVLTLATADIYAQFGDWPDVFNPYQVLTLNLEMDPADWVTIQNDDPEDTIPQIEVPAMFWADGESPILVSVRRKQGDSLQNGTPFAKVSLRIDINDFVTGQSWHGLKKVNLENGDDVDVVSEGLAWQIERLASGTQGYGYDAGHFAWVRLNINGDYIGVYLNIEFRDKRFMENRGLYTEGSTWLYKKVIPQDPAVIKVGGPQDSPATETLCYLPFNTIEPCTQPDLATEVPQHVNIKGLLALMANDAFQGNGDALFTKDKNYYYVDFAAGMTRMYFPWDRDSSLSGQFLNFDIYQGDDIYNALLAVPEFRAQYTQIYNDLICGPWSTQSLHAFLDAVEPVLTDALAADPNNQFDADVAGHFDSLRDRMAQRVSIVTGMIEGFQPCPTIQVNLNEFMAANAAFLEDPDEPGEYPDWIEVHNPLPDPVDLGGLYLTDDMTQPTKYQIPSGVILPGNGYLVFYADDDGTQGSLHTNFKLGADGEAVAIYDSNGVRLIDSVMFPAQLTDVSYGRFPDGNGSWGFMATPTFTATNSSHNAPPTISNEARQPMLPSATDTVWITASVVDDTVVDSVALHYDCGTGWVNLPMLDDGLSNDGAAGDGVYGASIPARPTDTIVVYYIEASDDLAATSTNPPFAPALTHIYVVGYVPPALYVNEFMADNDTTIEDPDEPLAYNDWLEIYNAEPVPVDLCGMYLTDDLTFPRKFQIPAGIIVPAGGHVIFWADNEVFQGLTHLNFKLGAAGEQIGLFDTDARGNVPIDTLSFGVQQTDVSQGRCPDGSTNWEFFNPATPDGTNQPCDVEIQACCLPGGVCQDLDSLLCTASGGLAQGSGSACSTTTCPECVADEDCDDGIICTIDRCDLFANTCGHTAYDSVCDDEVFCNGAEICDLSAGCISGTPRCQSPEDCDEVNDICFTLIPGDFNRDGDVDQDDYMQFESCASGPAIPYTGNCADADFDSDNDVDQSDFGIVQRCFSGHDVTADPNCAN
ncbi:MAG: lamin tail domain-containing protein [Planctomycetota bacterium]|jgi:hypothetical protein